MQIFTLPPPDRKLFRGDTIVLEAAVSQAKKAFSLTGYTIWFTAKPDIGNPDSGSGVIQKTVGTGITVIDAADGKIRIVISPSDTAGINKTTTYQCDVQVKNTSTGEISTVARGAITVDLDVTQAS